MSQTLKIKLSDKLYAAIRRRAQTDGTSPARWVTRVLEQRLGTSAQETSPEPTEQDTRDRFERHFGAVDLGHATGADNTQIDADIAKAYADNHESKRYGWTNRFIAKPWLCCKTDPTKRIRCATPSALYSCDGALSQKP